MQRERFPWFQPQMAGAHLGDRLVAVVGAALAILLTTWICTRLGLAGPGLPAVIAPLGASAVMVFVIPASPLAQPWRVIGGNVLSSVVGIVAYRLVPNEAAAAGLAVGGAILVMSMLRCLHPPGGAAALTAVIGGDAVHAAGLSFALAPVALNSVILVALALAFHRLTGHSYPHRVAPAEPAGPAFAPEDIDRALEDLHETFDIGREDLQQLLSRAEHHAMERRRNVR